MRKITAHIAIIIISLSASSRLLAQDMMDTVVYLHEVKIFAEKPLKEKSLIISEIDSISIREHYGGALAELLSNQSLIYIRSYGYGALSTASFRGSAPSHTRVYWNDLEINDPASGQVDFSLIPVCFVDEIKLYHGGSSLNENAGAIGGMVKLNSIPRWNNGISGSFMQNSGSYNSHLTTAGLSAGNNRIFATIKVYRESSDNDFKYLNDADRFQSYERYEGAGFFKGGIMGDLYLKDGHKGIFSLHTWLQSNNRNFAPIMSYMGPERDENQKDKFLRLISRWTRYGDFLRSEVSLGLSAGDLDYSLQQGGENWIYLSNARSWNVHTRYKGELSLGASSKIRTEAHLNYKKAEFTDLKNHSGFIADRPEAGTSFAFQHEFAFPLSVSALVRIDAYGNELSTISPSAGISYNPDYVRDVTIKANLSRNSHVPDLNDLHWMPGGNPDLKPESGYMADASAEYSLENPDLSLNASITAFYTLIDNWILWKPGEFGFWRAENIEKVKSRGIEQKVSLKYNLEKIKFRMNANYSFTRSTPVENNNEGIFIENTQLIYIPVHKLNGSLMFQVGQMKMIYQFLHTGSRFTTTDNDPELALPAFTLHDLKFSRVFKLKKFSSEFGFGIYNLLNTDYRVIQSRPMPGRHFNVLLRIDF